MRHLELVQDAEDKVVNHLLDCLRAMIKGRTGRKDARSGVREPEHVLKVNRVVGRLPRGESDLCQRQMQSLRAFP
jgi:hypothetical protein